MQPSDPPSQTDMQVTVAPDSALIGHTARQLRFRTYFQGAILALHRAVRRARYCTRTARRRRGLQARAPALQGPLR